MLEKAFQARFFEQVHAMGLDEITAKIEQIEVVGRQIEKGTEAHFDSKFLLRHLRRIRMEKALGATPAVH